MLDKSRKTWYSNICEYKCSLYADDFRLNLIFTKPDGVPEDPESPESLEGLYMGQRSQLIVVDASVLPAVISKVLEVKKLLASKQEKSSAAACKRVGISRSAYYKYKDRVHSYEDKLTQRIAYLHAVLQDEPGVLSNVLSALYNQNANILTVNQDIPTDGVAEATFSIRLSGDVCSSHDLIAQLSAIEGVVSVRILSGE